MGEKVVVRPSRRPNVMEDTGPPKKQWWWKEKNSAPWGGPYGALDTMSLMGVRNPEDIVQDSLNEGKFVKQYGNY